jgi:prevent-host-death family protein
MSEHTTTEAREMFSELVNRVAYGKERVVLTRRGKRLVAIVPAEDLETLGAPPQALVDPVLKALMDAPVDDEPETPEEAAAVQEAREDLAAGRVVSHEVMKRELLGRP